jgi:hypothetical protein
MVPRPTRQHRLAAPQQISGKFYAELMLEKHLPYTSAFAAQTVCMELKWDNWLFLLMIFI